MKKDLSISMAKGNLYALIVALPPILILSGLYAYVWGWQRFFNEMGSAIIYPFLAIAVIGGIVVHELLHGLTWQLFSNKPSGAVKYAMHWKTLTPYAHCKEPMRVGAYRLGVVMPGIILGILPAVFGIVTSSGLAMIFGLIFTLAASGDFLILCSWFAQNNLRF